MKEQRSIYKKIYFISTSILVISLGSLTACSSNNNVNTDTSSIQMISKVSNSTADNTKRNHNNITKPKTSKIINSAKKTATIKIYKDLHYRSKKFQSYNKMVLLDSGVAKVSLPTIKKKYLYKDVSELISTKGKPDYFLREKNSGVLRYTINKCPVIFFVVHEKSSNTIDNINSVCEKDTRIQ